MAVFDHLGLSVSDYAQSKAFYDAAIAAGAADNGNPGIRTQYHPNNYGAFVLDRDGYNIEAVCHMPEWAAMLRDAILRIAPQHEVVFLPHPEERA